MTFILRLPLILLLGAMLLVSAAGLFVVIGGMICMLVLMIDPEIDASWLTDRVQLTHALIISPLLAIAFLFVFRVSYMLLENVVERFWMENWERTQQWKAQVLQRCR